MQGNLISFLPTVPSPSLGEDVIRSLIVPGFLCKSPEGDSPRFEQQLSTTLPVLLIPHPRMCLLPERRHPHKALWPCHTQTKQVLSRNQHPLETVINTSFPTTVSPTSHCKRIEFAVGALLVQKEKQLLGNKQSLPCWFSLYPKTS